MNELEVKFPVVKVISAWVAALTTSTMNYAWDTFMNIPWDKLAQFAAFVYTIMLILEFIKKKIRKEVKDGSA